MKLKIVQMRDVGGFDLRARRIVEGLQNELVMHTLAALVCHHLRSSEKLVLPSSLVSSALDRHRCRNWSHGTIPCVASLENHGRASASGPVCALHSRAAFDMIP